MSIRRASGAVVAAGILAAGGASVAFAFSTSGDERGQTVQAVATGDSASPQRAAVAPPESDARRQEAIGKVAFLSRSADPDDLPDSELLPPAGSTSSPKVAREFARQVPGRTSTWLAPLETAGYALVTETGGAIFAPGQLEAGQIVQALTPGDGRIVVFGVVANGVEEVSITTANGKAESVPVTNNTFTRTYDKNVAKADRPVSVSGTGTDEAFRLPGILADGTIGP